MKGLSYIFAVYLLALACMPCSDSFECGDYAQGASIAQAYIHEGHSHGAEACSPFCICNCCGQQIVRFTPSDLLPQISLFRSAGTEVNSIYTFAVHDNVPPGVWQPPRLG